jgi:hypothetical protein
VSALDQVLAQLDGVRRTGRGFTARCPAHDDRAASLSVRARDDGQGVLLHCFAGCAYSTIARAIGLGTSAPTPHAQYASTLDEARAAVLAEARRQPWARMVEHYAAARWVRAGFRHAEARRGAGHALGDTEPGWELLAGAAEIEHAARALEATL